MADMPKISVERYDESSSPQVAGAVFPVDRSWAVVVDRDGRPALIDCARIQAGMADFRAALAARRVT